MKFRSLLFIVLMLFLPHGYVSPIEDADATIDQTTQRGFLDPIEQPTKSIIIATNLEKILISKNWFSTLKQAVTIFYNADNKLSLLKLIGNYSFLRDCYRAGHKILYYDNKQLIQKKEYLAYLVNTYPALKEHEKNIFDMLHEYSIDEQMIAFYLWLKISKNYTLLITTAKDQASYACFKKKIDSALQQKFGIKWDDLFDGSFHATDEKADSSYFLNLWHYLSFYGYAKDSTYILYIDNSEKNIVAAQAAHHEYAIPIEGIYYQNPDQIKHAITLLGKSLEKS